MRVCEVEEVVDVVAVETQGRELLDVFGGEPVVEHGVEDRDDESEGQGIEQRVEQRVEEIGYGVFLDGPGESQKPHVGLEHSDRV